MEQRGLQVVETNKTFLGKISNTITKLLVPTRIGLNSMMISIKRNSLIKAYDSYCKVQNIGNEDKKTMASNKYEDAYALYLEVIDKNIMESLYKKVKNGIANSFEKEALSKYYLVVKLKNENYIEYKYKKQEYLLEIDYQTASGIKKESTLNIYKDFYVKKMESLYKGLLKNYSVELTDNAKNDKSSENTYEKIFSLLEKYVSEILPVKISLSEENKKYQTDYEAYEEVALGKLNEQEKIIKNMVLIGISRKFFTHSLPLGATESCYMWLIDEVRTLLVKENNEQKRNRIYDILIKVMEDYNTKILSGKVYWENPVEKVEHKVFWDRYTKINELEDEKERQKQKIIAWLKLDLKNVYKDKKKFKKIITIYKEYLTKLGAMRVLKNACKTQSGHLKKA